MKIIIPALLAGLMLSGALDAHHSVAGMYDEKREVMIAGVVEEFHFINPHPYIVLAVPQGDETQQWKLEMDNRFELSAIGMTQETLHTGDQIVISGNPTNSQPLVLYIRKLQRPADGYAYEQVGFSPRLISPGKSGKE